MKIWARMALYGVLALTLLVSATAEAGSVLQLNLSELTQRAGKIFSGRLVSASAGTVQVGGTTLPTVTYRFRVDEAFLGSYATVKGTTFAEVTTIGKLASKKAGPYKSVVIVPQMPKLTTGDSYLLFVTEPSAVGLSTTVGLGQGAFALSQVRGVTVASNEVKNRGLFRGMQGMSTQPAGPIPFAELATHIRRLTGRP